MRCCDGEKAEERREEGGKEREREGERVATTRDGNS